MLPLKLLQEHSQAFPHDWRTLQKMRDDRGKALPFWPDWCYCPIAGAIAVITDGAPQIGLEELAKMEKHPPAVMAALAAWRMTKGVYRIDPDLAEELYEMPLEGKLPSELFLQLPEWCIYIQAPCLSWNGQELDGFFASLEYDPNDHRQELRFVFVTADGTAMPFALHLGDWDLDEAYRRMLNESCRHLRSNIPKAKESIDVLRQEAEEIKMALIPFINLTLYLCSINADYNTEPPEHPSKKAPRKKRLTAAEEVRIWEVGVRVGRALRQAKSQDTAQTTSDAKSQTHASPRPHIRRAHWHHFWTGPKAEPEKRQLILKWLPPIPVNIDELDDLPITLRPVN